MNKTRTYYQPFFRIDDFGTIKFGNMPSELHSFQAFATREDCEDWLENNGYDYAEYSIVEMHDDDIEGVTIIDEYGDIVEVNEDNDKPTIEDYEDTPTSDLFAIVASECSKETILSVAESYVGSTDTEIREFLFACMGFNIE